MVEAQPVDPRCESDGQGESLGFEPDSTPEFRANKTFWAMAESALRALDIEGPIRPGMLIPTDSRLKLPGIPFTASLRVGTRGNGERRIVITGSPGNKVSSEDYGLGDGLADFFESERLLAEGELDPDEVVLGEWHLVAQASVRSPEGDSPGQWANLNVHIYLKRTRQTAERYAGIELARSLPVPNTVTQKLGARVRIERGRTHVIGPDNSVVLSSFSGRGHFKSLLELLGHYDDAFRPTPPIGLLTIDQWQDAIETQLGTSSLLRMRRGQA